MILFLLNTSYGDASKGIWREQISSEKVVYNFQNFSGFYYDLDKDIGTEYLEIDISNCDDKLINKGKLLYSTKSKDVGFKFGEWGDYSIIGFLGDEYFSGYTYNCSITNQDINFLKEGMLGRIIADDKDIDYKARNEIPINLAEGYKILIEDINESQKGVLMYLIKNDAQIDKKLITFDDSVNRTCVFSKNIINNIRTPFIILQLKAPFEGFDSRSITVDAIFQISENPIFLKDMPKMDLSYSDSRISLRNNENIRLDRNSIIPLFGDIALRVADSDDLRFMLMQSRSTYYRSEPIYAKKMPSYNLTPFNFRGFYYDMDRLLGTELLSLKISEDGTFQAPYSIIYTTTAQKKRFNFTDWGYFNIIGFLGQEYFAGYISDENIPPENQILYAKSRDENSLADEQLQMILMDDVKEIAITTSTPLKLAQGYELALKSINNDEEPIVQLFKDGVAVDDEKLISQSNGYNPIVADETYYYKKTIGDQKDIVIIAVHIKDAFRSTDSNKAIVDGIWQISDTALRVESDTMYGNMRFANITEDTITMDNKNNSIRLDRGRKINLMGNISIHVADSDELRYIVENTIDN